MVCAVASGWLFDRTQNYDLPFLVVGAMGTAGGAIAAVVVVLDRLAKQRRGTSS